MNESLAALIIGGTLLFSIVVLSAEQVAMRTESGPRHLGFLFRRQARQTWTWFALFGVLPTMFVLVVCELLMVTAIIGPNHSLLTRLIALAQFVALVAWGLYLYRLMQR